MIFFPAFLDLQGKSVLLVGGGEAAASKLRLLRRTGARVTLVAPRVTGEIAVAAENGSITLVRRGFVAGDLRDRTLVVAASGRADLDERVAEAACFARVQVNVVDRPDLSSFVVPAIVDRDPVVIGISTGGAAPVLARRLRARIEALLPARLGVLARFAGRFRGALAANLPDPAARRRFWERFFDGPLAAAILAGREGTAREAMLALVNRGGAHVPRTGTVAFVDAGPGDPDLLTLRALRLLQDADVVVHGGRVSDGILDLARRDAERIDAGTAPAGMTPGTARGTRGVSADEINGLLVARARLGERIVCLESGGPFDCGHGGGAFEHLRRQGIEVVAVPGVTTARDPLPRAVAV